MWRDRVRRSQRVTKSRKLVSLTKLIFFGAIGILLVSFLVLPLLALNLPSPDKVVRHEGYATQILDRNGETLYNVYVNQRRNPVNLADIPLYLRQATIAIEDKNFYKHKGFDVLGILRGFTRIFTRGYAQGGSTLTQQLVKNVLLSSDRTLVRKIKEFVLAIEIETKYSKDEILQMYLNEAPYGGTAWGVEARFGLSYWDALIVAAAAQLGASHVLTAFYADPISSNGNMFQVEIATGGAGAESVIARCPQRADSGGSIPPYFWRPAKQIPANARVAARVAANTGTKILVGWLVFEPRPQ